MILRDLLWILQLRPEGKMIEINCAQKDSKDVGIRIRYLKPQDVEIIEIETESVDPGIPDMLLKVAETGARAGDEGDINESMLGGWATVDSVPKNLVKAKIVTFRVQVRGSETDIKRFFRDLSKDKKLIPTIQLFDKVEAD